MIRGLVGQNHRSPCDKALVTVVEQAGHLPEAPELDGLTYDERRQTVAFAQHAAEERERRIEKLVVEGPGICIGSKRPPPEDRLPHARWPDR